MYVGRYNSTSARQVLRRHVEIIPKKIAEILPRAHLRFNWYFPYFQDHEAIYTRVYTPNYTTNTHVLAAFIRKTDETIVMQIRRFRNISTLAEY